MHKTPGRLSSSCSLNRSWGEKEIPDVEFVVAKKDRLIHWVSGYCILREKAKFVINIHIATNGRVPMKYNWKKKIPQGEGQIRRFNFPESKLNLVFQKVWIVFFQPRNTLCDNKSTRKIKWHYFARWFNLVHMQTLLAFWSAGKKSHKTMGTRLPLIMMQVWKGEKYSLFWPAARHSKKGAKNLFFLIRSCNR